MKKILFGIIAILFNLESGYAQYAFNQAGYFISNDSYIAVPNVVTLNPTTAITLEAWVNPGFYGASTMAVIGKRYETSYFLGIQNSGRVVFYPKGGASFRSRVSSVIPVDKWTHIAASYDGANTVIYINGVADTSTTAFSGPIGVNTDSLYIGADRSGSTTLLYFYGKLDNVRIWGTARTAAAIAASRFIPLEVYLPSGSYDNLRASFQFDGDYANFSGSAGILSGYPRGNFQFINYSNKAVNYMDYNNSLVLNGVTDYFTVANNPSAGFNPTTAITLEAWVKRDTTGSQNTAQNIVNKSGGTVRYDYALVLYPSLGRLGFILNSDDYILQSQTVVTTAQWTHLAATYNSVNGKAVIYVNGDSVAGTTFTSRPLINPNNDNFYIGGIGASSYAANKFKGQIDGVKIWSYARTSSQIKENMYKGNESESNLTHFYFDKYTNAIYSGGARIYGSNSFVGSAHISSSKLNIDRETTSPMLYNNTEGFHGTKYTSSYKRFFVPDNNTQGIKDSIYIPTDGSISNLKVYVLMSHAWLSDINISLTSPSGTTLTLFNNRGAGKNDIMTIFSDDAESSISSENEVNGAGVTAPYSPGVKPDQPLSNLNGQIKKGWWKIKFVDRSFGDAGFVHGWGLNIPPSKVINLTAFIQGFYNSSLNKMIKDTVTVLLRNTNAGFTVLDSSIAILDSAGKGTFNFYNMSNPADFFIVIKHRNSIETWSSIPTNFASDVLNYDFSTFAGKAYGFNMTQIDASPVRYGIFNGNTNKDLTVDATDVVNVYNDGNNFSSGYITSDMTGDNITDLTDLVLTHNNAKNFVTVVRP